MIHYHGTPVNPVEVLYTLAGKHFCVSHSIPDQIRHVHAIGQTVMLDNGAYAKFRSGKPTNWTRYYTWCDRWLDHPTTWAIPPDVIDAPSQEQDALLNAWPHGKRQAAPVWHMDEPIGRLLRLCDDGWSRICMGSTAEFFTVLSDAWERRMDEAWDALAVTFGRLPPIHMLRGMQCSGRRWPFASADSTDVAPNHNRPGNAARTMADRWDAMQSPGVWTARAEQMVLV